MTVGELREKYLDVFGEETRSYHKEFLRKRIAWRIQTLAEGDLAELVERTPVGSPVPLNGMESGLPELVVRLAMDAAPADPVAAVRDRVMAQRLEDEIAELAARLDRMGPDDQRYSEAFAELLRLQDEKRKRESS